MPFGGWKWDQEGKPRLRAEGQRWQILIWKALAKLLSLVMDHRMILQRAEYPDAESWIDDMLALIKDFL